MRRRSMLKVAASFALLAAPRLAKASSPTTLRFVPVSGLVILDPVSTTGRTTRNHGFLVFDTLYGLDEALNPQPQMVAGHTIEDNGKRWTLTLATSCASTMARRCTAVMSSPAFAVSVPAMDWASH
jgi:peptide/nickel transport system substrate-binding protein